MPTIVLLLLLSGSVLAQETLCPKCLLREAKQELPSNDSSKARATLEIAAGQFEITDKDSPEHVEALVMLNMYLRWAYRTNLEGWKTQVGPSAQEALNIAESHPDMDPEILALALEIQSDVLGRSEAGLPLWAKAQQIRAARVAAVLPDQTQSASADSPVKITGNVTPPRLKTRVEPQYPLLAKHAGLECSKALMRVVIDSNGVPGQFQLLKGCGYGFDEQGADAVKHWRFEPSTLNGAAVATVAQIEVNFRLLADASEKSAPGNDAANAESSKRAGELIRHGWDSLNQHDYGQAQQDFEEATKIDPANLYAWNNLGLAYYSLRQMDKAEAAFRQQIGINATDPWAYSNLGRVLSAKGNFTAALEAFHKQISIDPDDKRAHLFLARTLEGQAHWDAALPEAQKSTELTPMDWTAWTALGRAQAHLGKTEEARKSFNRALDVNDSTTSQGIVAYSMLDANIDLERASQLVFSALAVTAGQICTPEQPILDRGCSQKLTHLAFLLHTAGWLLFKQGKTDEARPYLESAYAIAPHPGFALHLAEVYAKSDLKDAALRYCAIAELSPDLDADERNEATTVINEQQMAAIPKSILAAGYVAASEKTMPDGRLIVLVDPSGKILAAKPANTGSISTGELSDIQKVKLRPLAWPGHSFKSVRILEFRPAGQGSIVVSYVEPPLDAPADEESAQAETAR